MGPVFSTANRKLEALSVTGIWFRIFTVISKLSIFVNAIILAWTSDIINKFLYVIGHCDPEDIVSSPHLRHICRT